MKRPFFLLLIFVILSIVMLEVSNSPILTVVFAAIISGLYFLLKRNSVKPAYIAFIFIITLCFIVYAYNVINFNYDLKQYENQKINVYFQVLSPPITKSGYTQIYSKVYALYDRGIYKQINQKIVLNVYGKNNFKIKPGQKYNVTAKVSVPNNSNHSGEFDYYLYLKSKRIYSVLHAVNSDMLYVGEGNLTLYLNKIYDLKYNIAERIESYMPDYATDVIFGIIWGDALEDEEFSKNLKIIGASHILSVSGLHVAYIYLVLTFILKKTKVNIKLKTIIILSVLIVYAAMCGFSISIIRACIMFCVLQCCKIYKRMYDPLSSLSFAALLALTINPLVLFTASFQLSFSAMAGIIFFARTLNNKLIKFKPVFLTKSVQIISVTICVQLSVLPILLYHFSEFSLISIFSNVLIIPLTGLIVISSAVGMALCFLPFMKLFFILLSYQTKALIFFTGLFSEAKYANIKLDKLFICEIVVFYILLFLIFGYFDKNNKKAIYSISALVFICAIYSLVKVIV